MGPDLATPEPLRSRFCLFLFLFCSAALGPYLLETLGMERQMYSRLYLVPPLTAYLAFLLYWYLGARGMIAPGRNRWRKRVGLIVLVIVTGFIGVTACITLLLVYAACEWLARRVGHRLPGAWWRPSRRYAVAALMAFGFCPLINSTTLFSAYRTFEPPRLRKNPLFSVNAAGLRGPLLQPGAHPSATRLLFLGDSSTFGFPYRLEDAYPTQVKRQLEERGIGGVEIVNGGVPGQSLPQINHHLDEFLAYEPDIVLLMVGVHFGMAVDEADGKQPPGSLRNGFATVMRFLPPGSVMLVAGTLAWLGHEAWADATPEKVAIYRSLLEEFLTRIAASGRPLVVLEYPSGKVRPAVQDLLRESAARPGVEWLPLAPLVTGPDDLPDEIHPNPALHERIATAIVEFLLTHPDLAGRLRPQGAQR